MSEEIEILRRRFGYSARLARHLGNWRADLLAYMRTFSNKPARRHAKALMGRQGPTRAIFGYFAAILWPFYHGSIESSAKSACNRLCGATGVLGDLSLNP